ncbi:hypothetical protein [uncultured Polaribacter sp.]|uniref:hypothetical protein n=1 Tax=uncultured Polaribacter sp. TaxID=174711 RepID=UPI00261B5A4D|nr:hypothetical protein [uncultured Polaribacter sp.]
MKKAIILILITLVVFLSCNQKKVDLTCERIDYLIDVKTDVAKNYWTDFNRKTLFSPMLYYTKFRLYTINANEKLKNKIKIEPYNCCNSKVTIGFSKFIDTTNFYMNVSYEGVDSTALEYKNTLGMFSDVNLTEKFIPDVKDTEEWMSMVIHEMFHQYQRSFKKFRKEQQSSHRNFDRDTLNYFFKSKGWFNKSIKKENEILLEILEIRNSDSIKKYLKDYLATKEKRISKVKNEEGLEILDLENSLSKSEGTARYIEYCVKLTLKEKSNNNTLSEVDSKYQSNRFENYKLEQDKWMYNLGGGYYYSIGFNLTRVLEKLKIDYQKDIFSENKPFDSYLSEYL